MELENIKNTMLANLTKNEVVANNLANVQTNGYKKDILFIEYMQNRMTMKSKISTDFNQGRLKETHNPLDVALQGPGFFTIETQDGDYYTRDGHFAVGKGGELLTSSGDYVLGQSGRLYISTDGNKPAEVSINQQGDIYIDKEYLDTLKIVDVADKDALKKVGAGYYSIESDADITTVENANVMQGNLEESNVNPINEMIQLIDLQRQYESLYRTIRSIDTALGKAANDISRY